MEIFNRKLNMKNIRGLSILLILVNHGNVNSATNSSKAPTTLNSTIALKTTTLTPVTTTNGSITKSSTMPQVASSSSSSRTKLSATTPTTPLLTTTTTIPTTKAVPDICYEITCNNATCKMLNNIVNFTKDVQNCTRNTGYCYVKETVDSAKPKIVMYTAGCVASCTDKATIKTGNITDTFSCCQENLCNDHVHKSNSVEQLRYHFLLSLYCIVMSFLIGW